MIRHEIKVLPSLELYCVSSCAGLGQLFVGLNNELEFLNDTVKDGELGSTLTED